jgi:parallel beta-helix repeat protein
MRFNRIGRHLGLLVVVLSVTMAFWSSRVSGLEPIIVYPGQSIQAAINSAPEGSIIQIMSGTYLESIRIAKSLTLVGVGNSSVIQSIGSSTAIEIPRGIGGVTLANLLVNGSKASFSTGVYVQQSHNNVIENITVANFEKGIYIIDSSNNTLRNNRMMNNKINLRIFGLYLDHFLHNIGSSNLVDGKRVYYWVNQHNRTFPTDAGYVAAINCTGVSIRDLTLHNNFAGVQLVYTNNSIIRNVTCYDNEQGIRLLCSNGNTISNSTLHSNIYYGISLIIASNNCLIGNAIKLNSDGIYLSYSTLITAYSENNSIVGNMLSNNHETGIYFANSSHNKIWSNDVENNLIGVETDLSSGLSTHNLIYHNNLVNNTEHSSFTGNTSLSLPPSSWDDGYSVGGNYWSGGNGTDVCSGTFQNETGSDGICDIPHKIGENNIDDYPLVHPYGSVYNMNTSLTYLTIQSAISAPETLNGHVVLVKSGIYHESIIINKSLSLVGQDRDTTIIETEPEANTTTIVTNNATLRSFTIRSSRNVAPSNGIRLINASYNKIENTLVTGKFVAVKVDRGSRFNLIQNNVLRDNQYGVFIKRRASEDAVFGNIVFNNTIVHNFWNGIELAWCERNIIEANTIKDNGGFGIEIPDYTPSYNNVIFHNNFLNNSWNNIPVHHASDLNTFMNKWDVGGEGNFWDDYGGGDADKDGIGDVAYLIRSDEGMEVGDHYPLMGSFFSFGVSDNRVSIISNSIVTHLDFRLRLSKGELALGIYGDNPNAFLRMRIPRTLLDDPYEFSFTGDTTTLDFRELPCSNATFKCLYVSYTSNGTRNHWLEITGVTQIPEYGKLGVFLMALVATILLVSLHQLRTSRVTALDERVLTERKE